MEHSENTNTYEWRYEFQNVLLSKFKNKFTSHMFMPRDSINFTPTTAAATMKNHCIKIQVQTFIVAQICLDKM